MKLIKRILVFFPALIMMYMMFGFSAAGGEDSSSMSLQVTEVIVAAADVVDVFDIINNTEEQRIEVLQPFVRKAAHIMEYLLLCILLILPIRYSFSRLGQKRIIIAVILCLLFACSDEWHQTYVDGRDGKVMDVLIDSVGIGLGSVIGWFFVR